MVATQEKVYCGSGGRKRVGTIDKPTSLIVMTARIGILVSEDWKFVLSSCEREGEEGTTEGRTD